MNFQEKVAEFMRASGQTVNEQPYTMTKDEADFRDTLLREEIQELKYAIADNNRVEILDALCDIKYINDGTANLMGYRQWDKVYIDYRDSDERDTLDSLMDIFENYNIYNEYDIDSINHSCIVLTKIFGFTIENFKTALDRVHASNMSKFTYDIKTAQKTQQFYKDQGIDTYLETREKLTTIYRKEDGKVLKSVEYHPVYLNDLV